MSGREEFAAAVRAAAQSSKADETEIIAFRTHSGLTRVANCHIHQNVAERNSAISVRAVVDRRIGTAYTNRPDAPAISAAVAAATENALVSPQVDDWPGLPANPETIDIKTDEATQTCTPAKRAELVLEAVTTAKSEKLNVAGALQTSETEIFVANNHSPVSVSVSTDININLVMMSLDSSGYAAWVGRDLGGLRVRDLSATCARKAHAGRKPADLEPGAYTVVLEPAAVADMLSFLAYVGLGALSVLEKRSFIRDKFGEQLFDEKISFWDDGTDARTLGPSFDFEGVPKQKVVFFDRGRAQDVVYDTRTAARAGRRSTGHALPAPNPHGPLPTNLFLGAGDTPLERMIAETERGVYVTRFHYTNIEEPFRAVLTGMTRDGTFLIENGKVGGALKNLRFTQSIVDALSAVVAVGNEPVLVDAFLGACRCPALKLDDFNFTGISGT